MNWFWREFVTLTNDITFACETYERPMHREMFNNSVDDSELTASLYECMSLEATAYLDFNAILRKGD